MRLIATKPEENAVITEMAIELREKGIYADITRYEDGFGCIVWSINDLQDYPETHDWPEAEKIRFMEYADHKIGGATEDRWKILRTQIEQYIDDRKETNTAYVDENYAEFDKTKFYIDVCGGGWVRMVHFNPDSNAGGQLVYDLLSDYVISEADNECATEEDFWNYLYSYAKQTLQDIDTFDFAEAAKEFVEEPCDCYNQSSETVDKLKQWAKASLRGNGGQSDE